jgi:DNA-binding beta-propeller fold protein YncE
MAPARAGGGPLGYAFGLARNDVTIFNVAARRAVETRPLGVTVRWLANAQRFWDGRFIWTYTFAGMTGPVSVIAIDPHTVTVARSIPTGGAGPAHSVMLTPDLRRAWVNVAGADELDVIDLAAGEVTARVPTGAFP